MILVQAFLMHSVTGVVSVSRPGQFNIFFKIEAISCRLNWCKEGSKTTGKLQDISRLSTCHWCSSILIHIFIHFPMISIKLPHQLCVFSDCLSSEFRDAIADGFRQSCSPGAADHRWSMNSLELDMVRWCQPRVRFPYVSILRHIRIHFYSNLAKYLLVVKPCQTSLWIIMDIMGNPLQYTVYLHIIHSYIDDCFSYKKECVFFFLNGYSLAMFDCQSFVVLSPGGLGLGCLGSATNSALLQTARGLVKLMETEES